MVGRLTNTLRKVVAFMRRDAFVQTSYHAALVSNLFVILMGVASYYFLARFVQEQSAKEMPGGYFAFLLIGLACYNYLNVALGTFSGSIRQAQLFGTLEAMMLTRTSLVTIMVFSSAWAFAISLLQIVLYLFLGTVLFSFPIHQTNIFSSLVVSIAVAIACCPIGIIAAAFVIAFKRGEPVFFAWSGISGLLSGVYYPKEILPPFLQHVANLLPVTAGLDALRKCMIHGAALREVRPELLHLLVLTLIFAPLSLFFTRWAIGRARVSGSLAQF